MTDMAMGGDDEDVGGEVARWKDIIQAYDREYEKWLTRGKKIVKRYRDDQSNMGVRKRIQYNILYSNVQTLAPALYGKDPKADVSRRFLDPDPVGRVASEVLERCLDFSIASQNYGGVIRNSVLDRLLPGRGIVWVRYVPHFRDATIKGTAADEGFEATDVVPEDDDGEGTGKTDNLSENSHISDNPDSDEEVYYEETIVDYVFWQDFGHSLARTWEEVTAIWRRVYLTKEQLKDRFGAELAAEIPLDYSPKGDDEEKIKDADKRAVIYEIWDKDKKQALWISKGHDEVLDKRDDPLKLEGFYPCPRPLYSMTTSDNLIPIADFAQYQDQAYELDDLSTRIARIERSLKVAGAYDASAEGLARILNESVDNELIPVTNFAGLGGSQGLEAAIAWLPIKQVADTLLQLIQVRERIKQDLYEITGMSDIMRGATDPDETATAQQIKSGYGMLRLQNSQNEVKRFVRDSIRIMGQIIAGHFGQDTIKQISGAALLTNAEKKQIQQVLSQKKQQLQESIQAQAQQQPGKPPIPPPTDEEIAELAGVSPENLQLLDEPSWEEVTAVLRDTAHLAFHIDIETDSTILQDEQQEKESRNEFVETMVKFLATAGELGQQQPLLVPLLGEMLMFGVRAYPVARGLETEIEATIQKITKQSENPPQKQDPEMVKVQGMLQLEQQKAQSALQVQQAQMQADKERAQLQAQVDQANQQAQAQQDAQTQAIEQQREDRKLEMEAQLKREAAANEMQLEQMRIQANAEITLTKAKMDNDTKILVAQIMAKTQLQQSAIDAENAADEALAGDGD